MARVLNRNQSLEISSSNENSQIVKPKLSVQSCNKIYKCQVSGCTYRSKTRGGLVGHKQTHETELELRKPYPCPFDGCEFRSCAKTGVRHHVNSKHTPGRKREFECNLCPSKFYTNNTLKEHVGRHVQEDQFICNRCNFKTYNRRSFTRHLRIGHETLDNFKCSFPSCTYSTVRREFLKLHLQSHDPDPLVQRPFPCHFPACTYRAPTRPKLNRHIRGRHNPNRSKDFPCNLCSRAYFSEASLRVHIRVIHTNEKAFRCDKCCYKAREHVYLKLHYQRVHQNKEPSPHSPESCKFSASTTTCQPIQPKGTTAAARSSSGTIPCENSTKNVNPHAIVHVKERDSDQVPEDSVNHTSPIILLTKLRVQVL